MKHLAACVVLAGCNSLLGNHDFAGPDKVPTCADRDLPSTALSGTVFAPNGTLPIYNALVYVPAGPLDDIPDGPSGPTCASGSPAVTAFSDTHGQFKLEGVPVGVDIPLVIQVGKWRRAVTVPPVAECTVTAVDASLTHLPRDRSEGHIPRIAITTGLSDTLECLARDLGLADSEIGAGAASAGRVRLYAGNGARGTTAGTAFEPLGALVNPATLAQYDAVMIGCSGAPTQTSAVPPGPASLFDFTNRGGWLWLTHFEFPWLQRGPAPWSTIGTFINDNKTLTVGSSIVIDQSSPHGQAFAEWSAAADVPGGPGTVTLQYGRSACTAADPAARRILSVDPATAGFAGVQMFAWDAAMGGRMVFSDVHLSGTNLTGPMTYPDECVSPPPEQEKVILFQMFDTPTCVN